MEAQTKSLEVTGTVDGEDRRKERESDQNGCNDINEKDFNE